MIPSPTDTEALANRINLHTRDLHNKIDKRAAVKFATVIRHEFIYTDILKTYFLIFYTLENKIDEIILNKDNNTKNEKIRSILMKVYDNRLRRTSNLIKDLQFFGINAQDLIDNDNKPVQLQEFLNYISNGIDKNPVTILAYCHVLYLALFAGGKIFKSNFYKKIGFLSKYDNKKDNDKKQNVAKVTNFFTFEDTNDLEVKLKLKFKQDYEIITRDQLNESEKLSIIDAAKDIFQYNFNVINEIYTNNENELKSFKSFKIISYLVDEWIYNEEQLKPYHYIFTLTWSILLLIFIKYLIHKYIL